MSFTRKRHIEPVRKTLRAIATRVAVAFNDNWYRFATFVDCRWKIKERKEQLEKKIKLENLFFSTTNAIKVNISYERSTLLIIRHFLLVSLCLFFFCLSRVVTKPFCCQVNLMAEISLRVMNVSETRGLCQRIMMHGNFTKCRARVTSNFVHHAQSCRSIVFPFSLRQRESCVHS